MITQSGSIFQPATQCRAEFDDNARVLVIFAVYFHLFGIIDEYAMTLEECGICLCAVFIEQAITFV